METLQPAPATCLSLAFLHIKEEKKVFCVINTDFSSSQFSPVDFRGANNMTNLTYGKLLAVSHKSHPNSPCHNQIPFHWLNWFCVGPTNELCFATYKSTQFLELWGSGNITVVRTLRFGCWVWGLFLRLGLLFVG